MDNNIVTYIVLGLLGGLMLGLGLSYFFKSKNKGSTIVNNQDEFLNTIKDLEDEKANLLKKLADNENILKVIQEAESNDGGHEKLLKEIKNLRNNLEDVEDELESQKKINKKVRDEKGELEEEKEEVERSLKLLYQEQEDLKNENEAALEESRQNSESLTFINNILNAQNSSNKDFEKLSNDTWEIYFFITDRISRIFSNADELNDDVWEWKNMELKSWLMDKKKIAIVGEFSAGKTSIINRILSQDNPNAALLPVSSKETTAIPTYISRGKDFNCQFLSPDNELRNINKETFSMVTKSVVDKVKVSHLIKYFVLSYDNKYLENLSILDTPGFASNSAEIIKGTADVVREADAVFWVIDANTGDINQTSISVMQEHLNDLPIYFIINKSDTKSQGELDKLETKIKETAKSNNITYKEIIRFSHKENVEILMKHINTVSITGEKSLMKSILESIDEKIIMLEDEKRVLVSTQKENARFLSEIENNFGIVQSDIGYSVESINRLVKMKDSFFSGVKYQIDKSDYSVFQSNVMDITGLSQAISEQVQRHSEIINEKVKTDGYYKENSRELADLRETRKDFVTLISKYNNNLLN